jgi:tetratricopeptide (TPR) repeat protein/DNA-binding CsgD family transcriptional regulator
MQNNKYTILSESSFEFLEIINAIKFTPREIDIMACILGGRGRKTTASLLSITEKTVEAHIRNISLKLECSSQENIREEIERSDKFAAIKRHYLRLLTKASFEQCLQKISALVNKENPSCCLIYWKKDTYQAFFIHQLKKHLTLSGIKVIPKVKETYASSAYLIQSIKGQQTNGFICVFPQSTTTLSEQEDNNIIETIYKLSQKASTPFVFLGEKDKSLATPQKNKNVNFKKEENYYFVFFSILVKIMSHINIDEVISGFQKQYDIIYDTLKIPLSQIEQESSGSSQKNTVGVRLNLNFLKNKTMWLFTGQSLYLIIFIALFLSFFSSKVNESAQTNTIPTIRSSLIIPVETTLLNRPELIAMLEEKLKGQEGIQTAALIGIGGAGKTTLARQYARLQKTSVIWEINAETETSLKESFESLAYALCEAEKEKILLREIKEIKNPTEKENKIFSFVQEKLKNHPNWLLIYDNVEKFSDIHKYFPHDSNIWGTGCVIVTTRNMHFQNSEYINHSILVGELNPDQKLSLFLKIMESHETQHLSAVQKEETKAFLQEIMSFPLDVTIAAYYIKAVDIPYKKYLENLNECNKDFIANEKNVLKESSEYSKTRYHIVTLSLKKLIDSHKDFEYLFLLISLINSQNISRDLLMKFKSSHIVDNFIYHLKKYSFIIDTSSPVSTFSVHRSTQAIMLAYFKKTLNTENNSQLIQPIAQTLENYTIEILNERNFTKVKFLTNHLNTLLEHSFLNNTTKELIEAQLGSLYLFLGDYSKAKEIFKNNFSNLSTNHKNFVKISEDIASVYKDKTNYKKAKDLLEQQLLFYKETKDYLNLALVLQRLGDIYEILGYYEKAKSLLEESQLILEKHFSKDMLRMARVLTRQGILYKNLGRYKEAKEVLEKSIITYKKFKNLADLAWALGHLGNVYKSMGDYKKAKAFLEKSLQMHQNLLGKENIKTSWVEASLGILYKELKKYSEARNLLEKARQMYESTFGKNNIRFAWVTANLGNIHTDLGNYKKAKSYLEQSLAFYEDYYGEHHIETARILRDLSLSYLQEGKINDATKLLDKASGGFLQKRHPDSYMFYETLAELYLRKSINQEKEGNIRQSKKFKIQAIDFLKQALETVKNNFSEESPHTIRIQSKLKDLAGE